MLVLILGTALLRLAFAISIGLGVDETYAVVTARQLQLSTFDHPPLAWWITWAASTLSATENPLILRLPFITLFALTTWLMFRLTERLFDARAALWAAATLNLAPVLAWTSGSWILPDGPLNAALLASALCTAEAVLGARDRAPLWWLAAGGCAGLALLSKLHGVFLLAGVGLFLITSARHRHWLASPWPHAGAALALVMFLPVIIWNYQHDWAMFAFQLSRSLPDTPRPIDLLGPLKALAGQAVLMLPWLWLPLAICLGRALVRGPADERRWLLACLAVGPIATFTAVGLTGTRMFHHWAAPGYLMAFPLLGAAVAREIEAGYRRTRVWLIATAASLAVLLASVTALARLPWPQIVLPDGRHVPYPLSENIEWGELTKALEARGLLGKPGVFVAAMRWHEAAKIGYVLNGLMPVVCLCPDARGFGVSPLADAHLAHLGEDAIIIGKDLSHYWVDEVNARRFGAIESLPPVVITHAGQPAVQLSLYRGRGLRR